LQFLPFAVFLYFVAVAFLAPGVPFVGLVLARGGNVKIGGADRQVFIRLTVFQKQPDVVLKGNANAAVAVVNVVVERFDVAKRYAFARCSNPFEAARFGIIGSLLCR